MISYRVRTSRRYLTFFFFETFFCFSNEEDACGLEDFGWDICGFCVLFWGRGKCSDCETYAYFLLLCLFLITGI